MIESEYVFLERLLKQDKLTKELKNKTIEFMNTNDYEGFIKKYNLDISSVKAFSTLKDKIAYLLVEEYLNL